MPRTTRTGRSGVDAYLAQVRPEQRAALQPLRKQIHAAAMARVAGEAA